MKVAIVGSRDYHDWAKVREYVRALPFGSVVVSGGARGVDRIAENEARRHGIATEIFPADWQGLGKRAGFVRNQEIVDAADRVVAFWNGVSRGTAHTIELARMAGKPLEVIT